MPKLQEEEIRTFLTAHPGWQLLDGALTKEWLFSNFAAAMVFVNKVAQKSEQSGHHPDIDIRYNKVRLSLISHDSKGITEKDLALASLL